MIISRSDLSYSPVISIVAASEEAVAPDRSLTACTT
jgi:hypothetical protein